MTQTNIGWTEQVWNVIVGCSIVSPGCIHCYAMPMAARIERAGIPQYAGLTQPSKTGPVWTGKLHFVEHKLTEPLQRKKPTMWFVNSMGDLFHEGAPVEWIERIWRVMADTPHHAYQILTKRPERMAEIAPLMVAKFGVLPNVWLGTSVEDEARLVRLDILRRVPAAIRFVSFEPLLESVASADLTDLHWVIVGGESGPKRRPFKLEWAGEIRDLCRGHGIPFFFKQVGGLRPMDGGCALDGRQWKEWPRQSSELGL